MVCTIWTRFLCHFQNGASVFCTLVFAVGRQKSTAPTSTAVVSNRPDRGRLFDRNRPWFPVKIATFFVQNECDWRQTPNWNWFHNILALILCVISRKNAGNIAIFFLRSDFTKKCNWYMGHSVVISEIFPHWKSFSSNWFTV